MEPIARQAGDVGADNVEQLRVDQPLQQVESAVALVVGERGGRPARQALRFEQAHQPHHATGVGLQAVVGQREAGADDHVAVRELVEPVPFVGQPADHGREGPVRSRGQSRANDAQCQWKSTDDVHQCRRRNGLAPRSARCR